MKKLKSHSHSKRNISPIGLYLIIIIFAIGFITWLQPPARLFSPANINKLEAGTGGVAGKPSETKADKAREKEDEKVSREESLKDRERSYNIDLNTSITNEDGIRTPITGYTAEQLANENPDTKPNLFNFNSNSNYTAPTNPNLPYVDNSQSPECKGHPPGEIFGCAYPPDYVYKGDEKCGGSIAGYYCWVDMADGKPKYYPVNIPATMEKYYEKLNSLNTAMGDMDNLRTLLDKFKGTNEQKLTQLINSYGIYDAKKVAEFKETLKSNNIDIHESDVAQDAIATDKQKYQDLVDKYKSQGGVSAKVATKDELDFYVKYLANNQPADVAAKSAQAIVLTTSYENDPKCGGKTQSGETCVYSGTSNGNKLYSIKPASATGVAITQSYDGGRKFTTYIFGDGKITDTYIPTSGNKDNKTISTTYTDKDIEEAKKAATTPESPNSATSNTDTMLSDAPGIINYDTAGGIAGFVTGLTVSAAPCTIPLVVAGPFGLPSSIGCRWSAAIAGATGGNKLGDYLYNKTQSSSTANSEVTNTQQTNLKQCGNLFNNTCHNDCEGGTYSVVRSIWRYCGTVEEVTNALTNGKQSNNWFDVSRAIVPGVKPVDFSSPNTETTDKESKKYGYEDGYGSWGRKRAVGNEIQQFNKDISENDGWVLMHTCTTGKAIYNKGNPICPEDQ